jgi:hypothetical protein
VGRAVLGQDRPDHGGVQRLYPIRSTHVEGRHRGLCRLRQRCVRRLTVETPCGNVHIDMNMSGTYTHTHAHTSTCARDCGLALRKRVRASEDARSLFLCSSSTPFISHEPHPWHLCAAPYSAHFGRMQPPYMCVLVSIAPIRTGEDCDCECS